MGLGHVVFAIAATAVAMTMLGDIAAQAQSAPQESVLSRPRPEFDPNGIAMTEVISAIFGAKSGDATDRGLIESLVLYPTFDVETEFDSNVFRTPSGAKTDRIMHYRPGLAVRSDWENHALSLAVTSDMGRFDTYGGENYDDAGAVLEGRLDIEEFWTVTPTLSYRHGHELRGSPDDPGAGTGPTTYDLFSYGISSTYQRDAWIVRPGLRHDRSDFHDSGLVDNDDRDRRVTTASTRVGFEFSPDTILYVEPSHNWVRYDQRLDNFGVRRDSTGDQGLVGLTWDVSGVTFLDFAAGYMRQRYDDPTLSTVAGPTYRTGILWNATGLITVSVNGARSIRETTLQGAGGVFETSLAGRIDYELRDNILVDLRASWQNDDYRGLQRKDDILRVGIGFTYFLGRNLVIGGSLNRDTRSSDASGADYEDYRALLRIGTRF
ncbi:MAG: outer membrane beta-barrel protein [Alphaproteobacteria bacterium]